MNPRADAHRRIGGAYDVRVLEPSPPPVTEPPWFADDPVAIGTRGEAPVLTPVSGGDMTWDDLARDDDELRAWCADRWLGGWRRLTPTPEPDAYAQTRAAWHTLAEHVLAPARHAATGKIGLRFTVGGFGTPFFADADGRVTQVRVDREQLMVRRGDSTESAPITTVAGAAGLARLEPGAPTGVYEPTTPLVPSAPLTVDPGATRLLADWFGFATSVLEELRAEARAGEREATRVQLWPEHFDLAIDLGDDDTGSHGTFGASPGDEEHPESYLYVTHWAPRPPDPFWNEDAFGGAGLSLADLAGADDQRAAALDFFRRGRRLLAGA